MNTVPNTIIRTLRSTVPVRPLTIGEAYAVAEIQASKIVAMLGVQPLQAVDLTWITQLPRIKVTSRPRHEMPTLSGFTQWENGHYLVVINRSNNVGRRRFTLGHEFKHVLDNSLRKVIYKNLTQDQIERIANYFSACLLMPRRLVKSTWGIGIQDVEALAQNFRVSSEAMTNRLKYLGLIEDEQHPVEALFRHDTPRLVELLRTPMLSQCSSVA